MRAIRLVSGSIAVMVGAAMGCAKHAPEPVPHPTTPHISWSLGAGPSDTEVCASTAKVPCVLTAMRNGRAETATFHVFLHPAASDVKYAGEARVGFMTGPDPTGATLTINQTVKQSANPMNASVTGPVKSPGTYDVDINVTGSEANKDPVPLKDHVQVVIK